MLSNGVDFKNGGATRQEESVDPLFLGQGDGIDRHGQEGRTSTGDAGKDDIALTSTLRQVEDFRGSSKTVAIRNGMGSLDDSDSLEPPRLTPFEDHQSLADSTTENLFQCLSNGKSCLPCSEDIDVFSF